MEFWNVVGTIFLAKILDRTTRRGTLLLHINKEDLIKDVTVIMNPDWTDHEAVPFKILRGMGENNSTIKSLSSRRMHFGLFREMVGSAKEVRPKLRNFMAPIPCLARSALRHPSLLHLVAGSGEVLPTA